jgi:hypothetical protein
MNTQKQVDQLVIGLPESGKTTFLAALYHVVTTDEVPGALELAELHGNRDHVSRIHSAWLRCEEVGRTAASGEGVVSLRLRDRSATEEIVEVIFADMMGESFQAQWTEREWSSDYARMVGRAAGALLFVHPNTLVEPHRLDLQDELLAELPSEPRDEGEEPTEPWSPDTAPTQVQLVELLQFIAHGRNSEPIQLAVVISAWDLLGRKATKPKEWVTRRLPLLDQYLRANPDLFELRIYGVSAQGGTLDGESRDTLLAQQRPSDRIIVVGEGATDHDLTAPVRWTLERKR